MNSSQKLFLAARQLGVRRLFLNGLYRFASITHTWEILTPMRDYSAFTASFDEKIPFPLVPAQFLKSTLSSQDKEALLLEADRIVSGTIQLFGEVEAPLKLDPEVGLSHWSHFDKSQFNGQDIKYTWEPARFAWAITLARAYLISGNEVYPQTFWRYLQQFMINNPPNCGPNWTSGQEIAIRILVLAAVYPVFNQSPQITSQQKGWIARLLASHAQRIPLTILYAQSQDNNHFLVEAAGLYTAGVFLSDHSQSIKWQKKGWKWFNQAVQHQIQTDGTYTQHSCYYHRLMLQTAVWMSALSGLMGSPLPALTLSRLKAATLWLAALMDPLSGRVPNLGNNDGAYILPFTSAGYRDFRPVIQASFNAFLGGSLFEAGAVDEMSHWMGFHDSKPVVNYAADNIHPSILKVGQANTWAALRAAHFSPRAAHADQLHVDLWAFGENICLDAGTYSYNANPPWDNPLSATLVHNTVQLQGMDQMIRAGRFLWLRLAQARILSNQKDAVAAEHDGYISQGWIHRRSVEFKAPDKFIITDSILSAKANPTAGKAVLHWLFPDWSYGLSGHTLTLAADFGQVQISIHPLSPAPSLTLNSLELIRAGQRVAGSLPFFPYMGWYSPTYGIKKPAVSFSAHFSLSGDVSFSTEITVHQTLNKP